MNRIYNLTGIGGVEGRSIEQLEEAAKALEDILHIPIYVDIHTFEETGEEPIGHYFTSTPLPSPDSTVRSIEEMAQRTLQLLIATL